MGTKLKCGGCHGTSDRHKYRVLSRAQLFDVPSRASAVLCWLLFLYNSATHSNTVQLEFLLTFPYELSISKTIHAGFDAGCTASHWPVSPLTRVFMLAVTLQLQVDHEILDGGGLFAEMIY